jgi:hypothetical protein
MIIKFKDFLLENKNYVVDNLFNKYKKEFSEEPCSDEGVKESLSLIGEGEITYDDYKESYLYKEMINNDKYIFVVHGKYTKSPFGFPKGYWYDIAIYKNEPSTDYEGTGVILPATKVINHPLLERYTTENEVYFNKEIISKVCTEMKYKYEIS